MRLSFALRGTWDDPPNLALGAIAQLEAPESTGGEGSCLRRFESLVCRDSASVHEWDIHGDVPRFGAIQAVQALLGACLNERRVLKPR